MDGTPLQSEAVYVVLCHEMGTPSVVKMRRDVLDTNDMVASVDGEMNGSIHIRSGSHREGFRLKTSDVDELFWRKNHKVICDISQYRLYHIPQHVVILMEWEDLPPGFTRLRLLTESHYPAVICSLFSRNGNMYISSESFKNAFAKIEINILPTLNCRQNGPSLSFRDGGTRGSTEYDHVHCLRSEHWPTLASSMIERCRQKGWPSSDVLYDIVKFGIHVVPIGSDHTKGDEWRISFSEAERKLVYSMNHTQFMCYGLMKIFLKEVINSKDAILCSYFMKNILFWVIREDASLTWEPNNLLSIFWNCFKWLINWVMRAECPNFFIPQNNMFRVKVTGAAQFSLFEQLQNLYCKGMMSCLSLSPTLRSYLSEILLNETLVIRTDEASIISSVTFDKQVFEELSRTRLHVDNEEAFEVYMTKIDELLKEKQGPYQLLCIQKLSSVLLISTAWLLAGPCNKSVRPMPDKICHMLTRASKIGYLSDILYLAMYYYRTCRYEQSLICLHTAQERMSVPYAMYGDNVNVEMYRRAMTGLTLTDKMREAVLSHIVLVCTYEYIDELWLEQKVSNMNGTLLIHIPPLVMLHMLTVLTHQKLGHTIESHQALHNLQTLLLNDNGVHIPVRFRDISYQILGICQHVCGDYVGALNSYGCSFQQDPVHNIQQASVCRILNSHLGPSQS